MTRERAMLRLALGLAAAIALACAGTPLVQPDVAHVSLQTYLGRSAVLDAIEPEAVASLSPRDIDRLGIRAGERIRVQTRRGAIEMKARRDTGIPEGMIFIPFCFAEAAANVLTSPELDPIGKIPEFKFCAARIEAV